MSHRLHGINYRVFTTLLLIGLPVLVVASFLVLEDGRAKLREAFGLKLSQRAEQSASAIDAYVYRRIVDVSTLARVPEVRAEAERANLRPVVPGHGVGHGPRVRGSRRQAPGGRGHPRHAGLEVLRRHHAPGSDLPGDPADRPRRPADLRVEHHERLRPERRGLVEARDGRSDARRSHAERRALGRQRPNLRHGDCGARRRARRTARGRAEGRGRHPRDAGHRGGHGRWPTARRCSCAATARSCSAGRPCSPRRGSSAPIG